MKSTFPGLLLLVGSLFFSGARLAQSKSNPGFEKLNVLVGEWGGESAEESPVRVSCPLVSASTAFMEILSAIGESEMVPISTRDRNQIAVTHFCSGNNQTRMRTATNPENPKQLDFAFVGASNLASPGGGHMHHLTLVVEDANHFTRMWTCREQDKPDATETFIFTRK
jgi:hypothetical protein